MRDLNWLEPDHYVRATDHIPQMLEITQALIEKGHAYEREGNVYFSVSSDPEFGKLSHIRAIRCCPSPTSGVTRPTTPKARSSRLRALQKSVDDEPSWDSPYGPGRPGWHVECSAMASRYLGPSIDIHGGGADLIFPHHECEVAQSENAFGVEPFARTWVHVAMVGYDGEKMSIARQPSYSSVTRCRTTRRPYGSTSSRTITAAMDLRGRRARTLGARCRRLDRGRGVPGVWHRGRARRRQPAGPVFQRAGR